MDDNDKEHDTQHEQDYFEPVVTVIKIIIPINN